MAIPAFLTVRQTSTSMACLNNLRQLDSAAEQYALDNGKAPADLRDLVGRGRYIPNPPVCPAGGEYRLPPGTTAEAAHVVCTVHGSMEDLQRQVQSYRRR